MKNLECTTCKQQTFYKKQYCIECGNQEWNEREPGTGELLAVTTVHVTPDGVRKPNRLGLARFEGGANLVAQLESDLDVGDSLKLERGKTLRDEDDQSYIGLRFVSTDE